MRLLVLHWGTRGGGPQMQARLAAALVSSDIVDFCVSYDCQSEVAQALGMVPAPSLVVGRTTLKPKTRILRRLLTQPADAWRLARFCRLHSVDVIYEVMGNPLQVLPRAFTRLAGVRVLLSVHDAVRHPGEESTILSAIWAVSSRLCDGIVTYSASVTDSLRASGKASRLPVFRTVHGAFGVARGIGEGRDLPPSDVVVGFFGRVERYKGVGRLAIAVSELQKAGLPVRLALHGRGLLDPHEQELLADARADTNNAWVSEEEVQKVIESFDVLALPYDEASQSGVLGYALSAGIPVVCTPVGGLMEQVRDSGAGLVSASMSPRDFAAALHEVVTDASLYHKLSEDGISAARTIYSWERVAADICHAAETVAQHRGKNPR